MRLFSIFLFIILNAVDTQPTPCKPGPQLTIGQTPCHITANTALNDRIVLFMKSMISFTINFIDGTNSTSISASSTLLKLAIHNDKVYSTCLTAAGTKTADSDGKVYNYTNSPIGRKILLSVGFYGNEIVPTPRWNIEDLEMSRANTCQIGLKPYGKYLQLYFDSNTNYEIYSAFKCVKK